MSCEIQNVKGSCTAKAPPILVKMAVSLRTLRLKMIRLVNKVVVSFEQMDPVV